jgi:hypothetical protein
MARIPSRKLHSSLIWARTTGALATAALCVGVSTLYAQQIKKTFPVGPKPSLMLRNQNGIISVKSWDQNQIEIQALPSSDSMEVMIIPGEQKVTVQTHHKMEGMPSDVHVDFEIRVPREATVRVDSERGQISVENVTGDVSIEGVSNAIGLTNVSGHITVRTVDGPVLLKSSQGHIEARSISGNLKFVQVNASELVAETNSGTISYDGDFGLAGHYILKNYRSPIEVVTTDRASFELIARSVEGSIISDLAIRPTPVGTPFRRWSPSKFLQGMFRNGESTVQITSYSGTIRLRGPR